MSLLTYAEKRGIQEGLKKGLQQGIQQGIQKGMQKGKQEGAIIAMHRLIELLFRDKFGDQELNLIEQIKEIKSQETLEKISLMLQKSVTIEEFKTRLNDAQIL